MIAPKPLLLVSATGDWTRNTPTEEFPALRRLYELYGKPENIETLQLDAPHNFNKQNREAVYRFFAKHILHDPAADRITEKNAEIPMLQDMLALAGRARPAGSVTYEQVFTEWKQRPSPADPRETLRLALAANWPEQPELDMPHTFHDGQGTPAIFVGATENGAEGRPALILGPGAPRNHDVKNFLTFNKSDAAVRVQNILTALAWLHKNHPGPIELIATGTQAGVEAEFAAALAPIPVKLRNDISAFHGTDAEFLEYFNVPGIQTAGGLAAAQRLAALHK